jgi:hypothetical protein
MTIQQIIDIPDSHRLTIDVPREIPAGRAVLTFTPKGAEEAEIDQSEAEYRRRKAREWQDTGRINRDAEWLNKEAAVFLELQGLDI